MFSYLHAVLSFLHLQSFEIKHQILEKWEIWVDLEIVNFRKDLADTFK